MITTSPQARRENHTSGWFPRRLQGRAGMAVAIPLLCAFLLPAGIAHAHEARARNEVPARIDNIWGGFDHQPTESQVRSAELARGIAPSAQEQRRETRIERQINQEILKTALAGNTDAAAG